MDVLLRCFVAEVGADTGMVLKREPDGRNRALALWGMDGSGPACEWITNSLLERALEASEALVESEYHGELAANGNGHGNGNGNGNGAAPMRRSRASTAVAAPILGAQERLGAVYAGFAGPAALPPESIAWSADSYARIAALCMEGSEGFTATLLDSVRDRLTGCLSHSGVLDALNVEIQRANRQRQRLTCCFIDLDDFKRINDRDGHLVGNQVLAAVGGALRDAVRSYDSIGRFGGDEFVLVLPHMGAGSAPRLAGRVRARVSEAAAAVTGEPMFASAGIAEWRPQDSALDLLGAADRALSEAKAAGGARTAIARTARPGEGGVIELARGLLSGRVRGRSARADGGVQAGGRPKRASGGREHAAKLERQRAMSATERTSRS